MLQFFYCDAHWSLHQLLLPLFLFFFSFFFNLSCWPTSLQYKSRTKINIIVIHHKKSGDSNSSELKFSNSPWSNINTCWENFPKNIACIGSTFTHNQLISFQKPKKNRENKSREETRDLTWFDQLSLRPPENNSVYSL